ncbi:MAG: hypothetical protein OEV99_17200 [Nitrospira sp.]|nr:hypothetical protein [Nitrospira sp.]MDH5499113.1 hypothetical protein [Nitrospira sp.]MDH5726703.1 hypothetical protein [Nitrospira sp.]
MIDASSRDDDYFFLAAFLAGFFAAFLAGFFAAFFVAMSTPPPFDFKNDDCIGVI